jgi:hypothetical protein
MDVSAVSGSSSPEVERAVLTLKKQHDVQQEQAQGLISLIQQAAVPAQHGPSKDGVGQLISVYA